MPDIKCAIQIDASLEKLFPLISTGSGLSKWWAEDVTERDGNVDLGFFNRNTVYSLRLLRATPQVVEWVCQSGQEWNGTKLLFEVAAAKDQTVLRFTHAGWAAESDYF